MPPSLSLLALFLTFATPAQSPGPAQAGPPADPLRLLALHNAVPGVAELGVSSVDELERNGRQKDDVGGQKPPQDERDVEGPRRPETPRVVDDSGEVLQDPDDCAMVAETGSRWIDRVNRGLHRAVCESALWFDNLFRDQRLRVDDREATYGRMLLGLHHDEREGLEDFTNFEANISLPNLERRLNAFVGRGDRDQIVSGQQDVEQYLPPGGFEDDDEWLVGLGYRPARGRRSKFSFDLGADLGFPMNPFVKARYRHRFFPGDRTLIRVRPVLFWEREEGGGVGGRIDLDHLIGDQLLFRWRNVGTWSEETEGLDWYMEVTLFRSLGRKTALAYQLGAEGETDRMVPVREQFARLIYRRQFAREWLYFDLRPGIAHRREILDRPRRWVPFLSVGVEMVFGNRPGTRRPPPPGPPAQ